MAVSPPSSDYPVFTRPEDLNLRPGTSHAYRNIIALGRGAYNAFPSLYGTILNNALAAQPQMSASGLANYQQYAPGFAQAESAANRIGQTEQARTDASILAGPGQDIARGSQAIDQFLDPQYYATREGIGQQNQALLSGLNPNALSGTETANIERNLNRNNIGMGTANTGSNIAAIKNAQVFGDRLQQKQNQVSNILSQVSSGLPALKTNNVNYNNLTGRTGQGAGQETYARTSDTTPEAFGLGSNLLGQAGSISNTRRVTQAQTPQNWERIVGSLPDYS